MRCLSGGDDGSFRGEICERVSSLRSPRSPMGAREAPPNNGLGFRDIGAFLRRGRSSRGGTPIGKSLERKSQGETIRQIAHSQLNNILSRHAFERSGMSE